MRYPITKRQLRQALGLFSFYRTYVNNFAMIAKPLTNLTGARKPMAFSWGENEQRAFDELRQKICQAPVLAVPQLEKPFRLYTDASEIALGCQLAQLDENGDEHAIVYACLKLSSAQRNWSVVEREDDAIVWALGSWWKCLVTTTLSDTSLRQPPKVPS